MSLTSLAATKKQKTLTAAVDSTIGAEKMVKVKFINNHMKKEIWQ